MHSVNDLFGQKVSRICYLHLTYILHTVALGYESWELFTLLFGRVSGVQYL